MLSTPLSRHGRTPPLGEINPPSRIPPERSTPTTGTLETAHPYKISDKNNMFVCREALKSALELLRGFSLVISRQQFVSFAAVRMLFEITKCGTPGEAVTVTLFARTESCKRSQISPSAFLHGSGLAEFNMRHQVLVSAPCLFFFIPLFLSLSLSRGD